MDPQQESIVPLAFVLFVYAVVFVPFIVGMWKAFDKARQPGWACLIPIYNLYVMCRLGGRSPWWMLLFLVPIANLFALVGICVGVARNYGKSEIFGFGLAIFPIIFWPILGFGGAKYVGEALR